LWRVVTFDVRHFDKVHNIDYLPQAARIQAGVLEPHLAQRLKAAS
jgi:alkyldihydroxyacetonephosphate synthase